MGVRELIMVSEDCQGGWELFTEKSLLPVKLLVKKMTVSDWVVACMVPRGNIMHCILKGQEDGRSQQLVQANFIISGSEAPDDIMAAELDMIEFLESGITDIKREGNSLKV